MSEIIDGIIEGNKEAFKTATEVEGGTILHGRLVAVVSELPVISSSEKTKQFLASPLGKTALGEVALVLQKTFLPENKPAAIASEALLKSGAVSLTQKLNLTERIEKILDGINFGKDEKSKITGSTSEEQ